MKIGKRAVSASVALLGLAILAPRADALPPTGPTPIARSLDPLFVQREATASPAIKARLAQDRQRVQANHLNYSVAYTTAMDRPVSALKGGLLHPDLLQRMTAQAPKSQAFLQATQVKRLQFIQSHPTWPTPRASRADLRPFLSGNFPYYNSLSQHMPVPSGMSPVPPIKDQNNCGSCFTMGPTTALEWSRLVWQDVFGAGSSESIVVSPQSALSCAHAGGGSDAMDECANGGFADDVARWMTDTGAQKESEYAYVDADVCCGSPNNGFATPSWCTAQQNASNYCRDVPACKDHYQPDVKAGGWGYLNDNAGNGTTAPTTAQLKSWISSYGAIVVAVNAAGWDGYGGGVFSNNTTGGTDHIVVLVGWDDTVSAAPGQMGAWIVQNSWGTGWGESCGFGQTKGYMYLAYGSSSVGAGLTLWILA